jgi:ribosomal protein S12 methylthiotransferase accessory factor
MRPDRTFARDGSDLDTFDDRVQYYAAPERAAALDFLTAGADRRHVEEVAPLPAGTPSAAITALCERLAAHGAEAAVVDITPPDIASAGLHVVRAVCPELCPIDAYHSLRFLGVRRLLTGAYEAGLRCSPLRLEEVNSDPHPFP